VGVEVRELTEPDLPFLREMLYEALTWRPDGERYPPEFLLAHEQVTRYHEGWGRPGDVGLVAEDGGTPVGALWYRLFTEDDHGEGYVDPETPELAIAVVAGRRGEGIGRTLLEAAVERAREDGVRKLSLSVDEDNPGKRLYARVGWTEYEPGDGLGRMVLEITPA
jgi:GNAT superfamily N-acetyltransferase